VGTSDGTAGYARRCEEPEEKLWAYAAHLSSTISMATIWK
jgi:hypothetical protein